MSKSPLNPTDPTEPEVGMPEPPVAHTNTDAQAVVPAADAGVQKSAPKPSVKGSLAGGTWVALIAGMLLLILLLVFIVQNQQKVELSLFAWNVTIPAGVGFLSAAILGALIMALVGGVRMLELRRQVRRAARAQR